MSDSTQDQQTESKELIIEPEPARRTRPSTVKQPTSSANNMLMKGLIIGALSGFIGGMVAVRVSPNVMLDDRTVNRQVVETEGELIADIATDVSKSVVSIDVTSSVSSFNPFSGQTFSEQDSAGSGVIISKDGLILTNKHVLPESLTKATVELSDGTVYEDTEVIGRDPFSDIAFLKIKDAKNLTAAKLGDSDAIRVGQKVIAIGNALGEFDTTVTAGIISGLGRPLVAGSGSDAEPLANLFQTDTAINPGNSGGPLLNLSGEVIGVNTAVAGGAENIGFAIPINDVKSGIASVKESGKLIRPYLGVQYTMLNKELAKEFEVDDEKGAIIVGGPGNQDGVVNDSPADKAGLQEDDIILKVNDVEVTESTPLPNAVSRFQVGDEVTLTVKRKDETIEIKVKLEQAPDDLQKDN